MKNKATEKINITVDMYPDRVEKWPVDIDDGF